MSRPACRDQRSPGWQRCPRRAWRRRHALEMHSLPPSATVRQRPPGARFGGGLAARRYCCSNAVGERPRPRRPSAVVDFVAAGAPAVVLAAAGGEPSRPRRSPVLAGRAEPRGAALGAAGGVPPSLPSCFDTLVHIGAAKLPGFKAFVFRDSCVRFVWRCGCSPIQACMAVRRALWAPRSVLFRGLAGAWQTSWYIDGRVASRRSALSPLGPSLGRLGGCQPQAPPDWRGAEGDSGRCARRRRPPLLRSPSGRLVCRG